ncbi:hypothetical protein LINPERHAP1_LOCUS27077 [Linum perenne]
MQKLNHQHQHQHQHLCCWICEECDITALDHRDGLLSATCNCWDCLICSKPIWV